VRELGAMKSLRWLCLARCEAMKGDGLQALEALPQLEHLDLTYSGVQTAAIERLPRLPSVRSLVLSHNLHFHGHALAAVANMPGLRRLELQGCATLAAKDVLPLVKLKELRHLDLRDCQGRFRGQTMQIDLPRLKDADEPEPGDPTPGAAGAAGAPQTAGAGRHRHHRRRRHRVVRAAARDAAARRLGVADRRDWRGAREDDDAAVARRVEPAEGDAGVARASAARFDHARAATESRAGG
jgi:hypothetical protein